MDEIYSLHTKVSLINSPSFILKFTLFHSHTSGHSCSIIPPSQQSNLPHIILCHNMTYTIQYYWVTQL